MRRISITLAAVLAGCASDPEPAPPPPNVVYIQSDTHRWGAMSFTQTPQVRTPNMDRLKQQGASLNRYYVNLPLCTPYRAIVMSGRWPYQTGLMANHMSLAERVDMPEGKQARGTIAWAFKDAGYQTAHFGKWHLGKNDARPFGFDRSVIWIGTNNHTKTRYTVDGAPPVQWEGESNASATVGQALEWMTESAAAMRPFFVVISLNPPHGPFGDAPPSKKALYPDEEALPLHPLDELRNWETHRDYHAWVSSIDDDVGRVSDKLDELGIAEDTVLVYTSDHGAMAGVDGVSYGQKRHAHDESSRVPFLIRWPGMIPADVDLETLSSTMDVFPTLASLVGLGEELHRAGTPEAAETAEYLGTLEGVDLSANLRGEPGAVEPDSVFLAHPSNMNNRGSRHEAIWRAVVTKDFTYSATEEGEYRLWKNTDDYQRENLVDDSAYLETRRELWKKLDNWMDRAERPFYDQWFAQASDGEVQAWNKEHGLGEGNADREAGKAAVFDLSGSKP